MSDQNKQDFSDILSDLSTGPVGGIMGAPGQRPAAVPPRPPEPGADRPKAKAPSPHFQNFLESLTPTKEEAPPAAPPTAPAPSAAPTAAAVAAPPRPAGAPPSVTGGLTRSRVTKSMPALLTLLEEMMERKASDIYLCSGMLPRFRVYGEVVPGSGAPTDEAFMREMVSHLVNEENEKRFYDTGDFDLAHAEPGLDARFRVNIHKQRNGVAGVFRHIPTHIPKLDELLLPPAVSDFLDIGQGLVIVTGPTGNGKTTTLASLMTSLANSKSLHIMTVENPIEFVLKSDVSLIIQREVGTHTPDFSVALMDAMREDIDVLMVGELRDLETIALALKAAEMGLLVFATLHTPNAPKAISRIIDVFPAEEQDQVRTQLSDNLRGVLAQQLVVKAEGPGRLACGELMLASPSLSYLIREGKTNQIHSQIQTGREYGMTTMDQSMINHYLEGRITLEELFDKCHRRDEIIAQGINPPPGK
ncbi:MAG: PilT/PilU family type 4a pilus ATPase [Candidatus Eremiobacterota bacterium]